MVQSAQHSPAHPGTSLFYAGLQPATSFLLFRLPPSITLVEQATVTQALLDEVLSVSDIAGRTAKKFPRLVERGGPISMSGVTLEAAVYKDRLEPTWSLGRRQYSQLDFRLAVIVLSAGWVCFHFSDAGDRKAFEAKAKGGFGAQYPQLCQLEKPTTGCMNAAFSGQEVKTLWLRNALFKSKALADSKLLVGDDLLATFDVFETPNYQFTAARCTINPNRTLGFSPRRGGVWIGGPRPLQDFAAVASEIIKMASSVKTENYSPFPGLATSVISGAPDVSSAFAVTFVPPINFNTSIRSHSDLDLALEGLSIEVRSSNTAAPDCRIAFVRNGMDVDEADVTVDLSNLPVVRTTVTSVQPALNSGIRKVIEWLNRGHIEICYGSGYTIKGEQLFHFSYPDPQIPQDIFEVVDFPSLAVTFDEEKPFIMRGRGKKRRKVCDLKKLDPTLQVKNSSSLFQWVCSEYGRPKSGTNIWLFCDDGAMEHADFIILNETAGTPSSLSLFHVKAAGTQSMHRQVSAEKFQEVKAQVEKNIDSAFPDKLANSLLSRSGAYLWYWNCGAASPSRPPLSDFLDALRRAPANIKREIFLVQPHYRKHFETALLTTDDERRRRQVHYLLDLCRRACATRHVQLRVVCCP